MKTYNRTLRTFLLLGAAIATTLTMLIGAAAFEVPGFSIISFAKEAAKTTVQAQSLCVSHSNSQNCTNQDPVVQGCDKDAQTVAFIQITDAYSNLIATVQRRYSPSCHTEWGRMINNGNQPLLLTVNNNTRSTTGKFVYSTMVFVPNLSVAPQIRGIASINGIDPAQGGGQGLVGIIPALPPAQN